MLSSLAPTVDTDTDRTYQSRQFASYEVVPQQTNDSRAHHGSTLDGPGKGT